MLKKNNEQKESLKKILKARDLILVCGKGGVGKSAISFAMAKALSEIRGSAVLIRLLKHEKAKDEDYKVQTSPNLTIKNISIENSLIDVLGRMISLPKIIKALLNNRVTRLFFMTAPSVEELIFLEEIYNSTEQNSKDFIPTIVDMPATGHSLSLLKTPDSVSKMVDIGPLNDLVSKLKALLLDELKTELIMLTLPEELPVNEVINLKKECDKIGIPSEHLIVNKALYKNSKTLMNSTALKLANKDLEEKALLEVLEKIKEEISFWDYAQNQINRLKSSINVKINEIPNLNNSNKALFEEHLFKYFMDVVS